MNRSSIGDRDSALDRIAMSEEVWDNHLIEDICNFLDALRGVGAKSPSPDERMHARILFRKWKTWLFSRSGKVYQRDIGPVDARSDGKARIIQSELIKTVRIGRRPGVSEGLEAPGLAQQLAAEIVSAYASHNHLDASELGRLVTATVSQLSGVVARVDSTAESVLEPAVPVRRSVSRDSITCLLCGKKQKLLKRHLASAHSLTPLEYREMFGLKRDYPMTAPSYVEMRSEIARRMGLGRPKKAVPRRAKMSVTRGK